MRTRLVLAQCGKLMNFPVFEGEQTLLDDLKSLSDVTKVLLAYRDMQGRNGLSSGLIREINILVAGNGLHRRRGRVTAMMKHLGSKS